MRSREPKFDRDAAIRQLQLASLPDLQGSIQANDNKSAAGLVVHGLLFAGVLSILANLDNVFDDATLGAKIAGGALLLAAAIAFAVSVLAFISAIRPGDPRSTRPSIRHRYSSAFFPPAQPGPAPPGGEALDEQLARLAVLRGPHDFENEYAAEQIQLAEVRITQATATRRGLDALKVELLFVLLFLLLVALVAVGTPPLAVGLRGL